MADVDFTSKELARMIYHIDEGRKRKKDIDCKLRFDKLTKDLSDLIENNMYTKADDREFTDKLTDEDEQLLWKSKILQAQVHKDEKEAAEDKEDWNED